MADSSYVLYVGPDAANPQIYCPGSRRCIGVAQAVTGINIQNVHMLMDEGVALPEWLSGTPMLVDMQRKQAFKGSDALYEAQSRAQRGRAPPPPAGPQPPVEMSGVNLHADDSDGFAAFDDPPASSRISEGKITEEELQKYIAERNTGGMAPPLGT